LIKVNNRSELLNSLSGKKLKPTMMVVIMVKRIAIVAPGLDRPRLTIAVVISYGTNMARVYQRRYDEANATPLDIYR
jgi:hypothetical protein